MVIGSIKMIHQTSFLRHAESNFLNTYFSRIISEEINMSMTTTLQQYSCNALQ